MRLSFKFTLIILSVLALTMGAGALVLIKQQREALDGEARQRAQTVLSFGEAARDYARNTLSPAVSKHTKNLVFEANSATFVARGTFEELRKRQPEYSFREASLNPVNEVHRADADERQIINRFQTEPG